MAHEKGPFEKLVESTLAKSEGAIAEGMAPARWSQLAGRVKQGMKVSYKGKTYGAIMSGTNQILRLNGGGKAVELKPGDVNDYSLDGDTIVLK